MGIPTTTGQLRTKIEDMEIGDYIAVNKDQGGFSVAEIHIGTNNKQEMPLNGVDSAQYLYFWYMIKVNKGLLISDRVIWNSVSWDRLNLEDQKVIQGSINRIGYVQGVIRSLSGGVAYTDENGNMSSIDKETGLAFPKTNEFDKYILGFPKELIQSGWSLTDVFHHDITKTWTQDTPAIGIGVSTTRVLRGDIEGFSTSISSTAHPFIGFRPCFEYQEE